MAETISFSLQTKRKIAESFPEFLHFLIPFMQEKPV
jgi:hypothetical protein